MKKEEGKRTNLYTPNSLSARDSTLDSFYRCVATITLVSPLCRALCEEMKTYFALRKNGSHPLGNGSTSSRAY